MDLKGYLKIDFESWDFFEFEFQIKDPQNLHARWAQPQTSQRLPRNNEIEKI